MFYHSRTMLLQEGVSISASDETSIDIGVLSFRNYVPATQQALTQYNVHSVLPSCDRTRSQLQQLCGHLYWQVLDQQIL